jgi:SAM-dependent methyltransferase
MSGQFYGNDQASIHHTDFGDLARGAAERLLGELAAAGIESGTVVDLGAGSGILARIVSDAGYDVVGVDISPEMVALARVTAPHATFHCGSLLDAELPPAVAVTAIGETLNYATDDRVGIDEVERLAHRVRGVLAPRGVFLFDVATPGRAGPDGGRQLFIDRELWTLYMRSKESGDTLERAITIFRATGAGGYRRTDEQHILRLYEPDTVLDALKRAGFTARLLDRYSPSPSASTPAAGWTVVLATPA